MHIHLLDLEIAGLDLVMDSLLTRVKTTRVTTHRDQARVLLNDINIINEQSVLAFLVILITYCCVLSSVLIML